MAAHASIPGGTSVGAVHLRVADVERAVGFYHGLLGFEVVGRDGAADALLGAGGRQHIAVSARETRGAPAPPPGRTGLYHVAINYPTRRDLSIALRRLASAGWALDGTADHLTHEALYLRDPDGGGVELAWDRDPAVWRDAQGRITMGTEPLDLDGLWAEAGGGGAWAAGSAPAGTRIGHVHLKVSDIPRSVAFYHEVLGFDLIMRMGGSAAFLSAGRYHHHLGLNTWESRGGGPPPAGTTGLGHFAVLYPSRADLAAGVRRVLEAKAPIEGGSDHGGHLAVYARDPDGIGIALSWDREGGGGPQGDGVAIDVASLAGEAGGD